MLHIFASLWRNRLRDKDTFSFDLDICTIKTFDHILFFRSGSNNYTYLVCACLLCQQCGLGLDTVNYTILSYFGDFKKLNYSLLFLVLYLTELQT